MKIFFFVFIFILNLSYIQAQHPYEALGKEIKIMSLSNGKYQEVMSEDTLIKIAGLIVNVRAGAIHTYVGQDTIRYEHKSEAGVASCWYSLDPMQSSFAGWSPYAFSKNNPVYLNDPDGKTPRVTVTKDASGNTEIKLQFNVLVTDLSENQAGAAHIQANEQAIRDQFGSQVITNEDGTTTTVSFEINFEYTNSDDDYNAFIKKHNGAALTLDYNEGESTGNDDATAEYEGGGIEFGKNASVAQIAHEIGHDIGFGDQYLQNKDDDGYALPLVQYFNTLMGTADKFSLIEAQKIANAVKEKNITDAVIHPIDTNRDLPVPGTTVEVYTGKGETKELKKAKVSSGKFGSWKTRQGQIIKE